MRKSVLGWCVPAAAAMLCALLGACTLYADRKPPGPLNEPIDAFEAVGRPQNTGGPGSGDDTLGNDVRQLQNAHQAYLRDQQRQAAEVKRRQAKCRAKAGSREVAIRDGSDDPNATYCQSDAESSR